VRGLQRPWILGTDLEPRPRAVGYPASRPREPRR
jgi:hypothetical protein